MQDVVDDNRQDGEGVMLAQKIDARVRQRLGVANLIEDTTKVIVEEAGRLLQTVEPE